MTRSERRHRHQRAKARIDSLYLSIRSRKGNWYRHTDQTWWTQRHHEYWPRLGHPCKQIDHCDWCLGNALYQSIRESERADATGME